MNADKKTPKQIVQDMLDGLPSDVTFDEIQYRVDVCRRVDKGIQDVAAGHVMTEEDVDQQIDEWLRGESGDL